MIDGKLIYNNLQSLTNIERKAIDIYENGTGKEFRDFFRENFKNEYDSFRVFKNDLFTKAKGYTKIENKVFTDALDEAFKQSSIYDVETYRNSKEIADKYFTHLGRTKESQDMILDYIANDIDIDSDKLLKANAKYFKGQNVNHGLYAFPDDIYTVKGPTDNPLKRIDDNINDIMKNKKMEMSLTSSEYMIGPIGVTGKTSPIAYHTNDIRSHLEFSFDGGKRVYQQNSRRGTGTVQDILDVLERESKVDLFSKHDELIGKGLDVESIWVKEDFYTQNKDYVHELMQKYNVNNLDLVHAPENTEKITPSQIERINIDDINLSHTSKNAEKIKHRTRKEIIDEMFINSKLFTPWGKRIEELTNKGYDIRKNTPDFYFFLDKESGKMYKDLLKKRNKQTILGFTNKNKDAMFIVAHGSKDGKISVGKGNRLTIEQLGKYLQKFDLIPNDVKNIYTIDCFGGLQKPVKLKNGVTIQSSHTSDKTILSTSLDFKEQKMISLLQIQGDDSIIPKMQMFQGNELFLSFDTNDFFNARFKFNADDDGQYYFGKDKPKKSTKTNKEKSTKNIDNNIKGQTSFIDNNGNIKQEYIKLTPQEAFDKYGPNDDRFYTSQGLDPKQQKEAIEKLNKKYKKPKYKYKSISGNIHLKQESLPKHKYRSINGKGYIKHSDKPKYKYKSIKGKGHAKLKNNSGLKTKSLNGRGKAGIIIASLLVGTAIHNRNKRNSEKRQENKSLKNMLTPNNNYSNNIQEYNQYAIQMAQDISTYRYGKHMTGFVNY